MGRGSGQAVLTMEGTMAEVPKELCDGLHDPGEKADDGAEEEDAKKSSEEDRQDDEQIGRSGKVGAVLLYDDY